MGNRTGSEGTVAGDPEGGTTEEVPAAGLFVLIGSEPRTGWLGRDLARDRWGFILTGQDVLDDPGGRWQAARPPLPHETSLPGVFVGTARVCAEAATAVTAQTASAAAASAIPFTELLLVFDSRRESSVPSRIPTHKARIVKA